MKLIFSAVKWISFRDFKYILENFIDLNPELTRCQIRIQVIMTSAASSAKNWGLLGTGRQSCQEMSNPCFRAGLQTLIWDRELEHHYQVEGGCFIFTPCNTSVSLIVQKSKKSFIHKVFFERLLCLRHYLRCCRQSSLVPSLMEFIVCKGDIHI